jgi:hypothetical protein
VSNEAYLDNSWILLRPLLEFIICELSILVEIHVTEDLVYPLSCQLSPLQSFFFFDLIEKDGEGTNLLWGIFILW